MELAEIIANASPGMAALMVFIYFYNQLTVRYLDERKEWLQSLAIEREDWNENLQRLLDRYDARMATSIEAMTAMRDQMHSLRGDTQKALMAIEQRFLAGEQRFSEMDRRNRTQHDAGKEGA